MAGRTPHAVTKGLPTVTTARGGEQVLVQAGLQPASLDPVMSFEEWMEGTGAYGGSREEYDRLVENGHIHPDRRHLVAAFLNQHHTQRNDQVHAGHDLRESLSSLSTTGSHQTLTAVHLLTCGATAMREMYASRCTR